MTGRQLKAIFVTLAVLVAVYLGTDLMPGGDGGDTAGPDIGSAVEGGVEGLVAVGPESSDSVRLRRTREGWSVNGYPADTARVHRALSDLAEARPERLVARSSANHARLGVAADSSRRVALLADGAVTLEFLLGRGGADGRYVRLPGSDDVYTVPESSVRSLDLPQDDWRDRGIATVDTASIIRIVVRRDDDPRTTILTRQAADSTVAWTEDGAVANLTVVRTLLDNVAELRATGFPSDSVVFAVDFDDPAAALELYDSEEPGAAPLVALLFVRAPDGSYALVRRASDPLVYRMESRVSQTLLPGRAALFPED